MEQLSEIALYSLAAFYAFFALISFIRLYKIVYKTVIYKISIVFYLGMFVSSICRGGTLLYITTTLAKSNESSQNKVVYFLLVLPDMVYLCVYLVLVWHFFKYFMISHINTANDLNIFVKDESEIKKTTNYILSGMIFIYIIGFIILCLLERFEQIESNYFIQINSSFNIITPFLFIAYGLFLLIKFSGRPYVTFEQKNETKDILTVIIVWSCSRIIIGILELIYFNDSFFEKKQSSLLGVIIFIVYFIVTEFIPDYFALDYNLMKTFIKKELIEITQEENEIDQKCLINQTAIYKKDVQTMKIPFIQITLQNILFSRRHGLGKLLKAVYKGKEVVCRQINFERFNRYNLEVVFNDVEKIMELQNDYICPIIGICDEDNPNFYIIYPFYKSKSIYDILHFDKILIPFYKKIHIALSIAKGLQYLHEKGIYHCHLSSKNIYLDDEFQPKIGDYGFENLKDIANKFNKYDNKNAYSPPEILIDSRTICYRFDKDDLNEKVDIYSFGILLWELEANTIPFDVKLNDLYSYVVDKNVRPEIQNNVDKTITSLIRSCWETEPQNRPNMKEIIEKLNEKYVLITSSMSKE